MTVVCGAHLDTDALDRFVRQEIRERDVPGLALAVVPPDGPVWIAGFGTTAVDEGQPVTGRTLFRIASVTKVLTGIALLQLVEDGTLTLDQPVVEHLPRLRLRTPGAAERITLRMLLSHTSGLPEGSIERPWRVERRDPGGLAAFVDEELPRFPMVGAPGELYFYSNLGVNLAGHLATVVTGVPFARLLDDLVLRPLALERTTLDPTVAMTFPLAQRHQLNEDGIVRVRRDGGDNTAWYPSGYAFSTAEDMSRVLRLLIGGGVLEGRRLLDERSVRQMQIPHADVRLSRGLHYGLVSVVEPDYKGIRRIGHEGVLRGYCSKITYAPDHGVGVVVLYNHEYNERPRFFAARERIVDRVFDELLDLPRAPVRPPASPVPGRLASQLWGRYAKVLGSTVVELRAGIGGIVLRYEGIDLPLSCSDSPILGCSDSPTLVSPSTDLDLADLPWPRTPYVIDDHVTVGVPPFRRDEVPTITINGQPYRRIR